MDNIKSLTQKVNEKTKSKPIFYVTNDSERALGLEKILTNYNIVCIDTNDIVDYIRKDGTSIFCLEESLGEKNAIFRNSNRLLKHKSAKKFINEKSPGNGYFMFFKIAPNLERTAEDYSFDVLNTSAKLNRKFELKMPQLSFLRKIDIRIPKTIRAKLKDLTYEKIVEELEEKFVVQFNRGHTGGGTKVINTKQEFNSIKEKFLKREVRVSKFIKGESYTLNACVTKHGVCMGGLSYQLTGIEECTSKKMATVGNDWKLPEKLDFRTIKEIHSFTKLIGEGMAKDGYKGMFGIDLVVKDKKVYIIEINARQPASIPMFTKLQLHNDEIPLSLLAMAEFLEIDYEIDVKKYNKNAFHPYKATQLFIRNRFENKAEVIGSITVGEYQLVGDNNAYEWSEDGHKLLPNTIKLDESADKILRFEEEAYSIDQIESGLLLLASSEGKIIKPNAEVARIQIMQSLLNDNKELKPWVKELLSGLNKNIILKELPNE